MIIIGIIIGLFIGLALIIRILKALKVCKLGFHDYVEVESIDGITLFDNISSEMGQSIYLEGKHHVRKIYDYYPTIKNMACIKCGNCSNEIDGETKRIKEYIDARIKERKEEEKRKQIATDIYNENCREN